MHLFITWTSRLICGVLFLRITETSQTSYEKTQSKSQKQINKKCLTERSQYFCPLLLVDNLLSSILSVCVCTTHKEQYTFFNIEMKTLIEIGIDHWMSFFICGSDFVSKHCSMRNTIVHCDCN